MTSLSLAPQAPSDTLWRVEDVARFLGVSERTVYDLPGLPSIRLKGRGSRTMRRYIPEQVRQWALSRGDTTA
jgi:hypothetical protein